MVFRVSIVFLVFAAETQLVCLMMLLVCRIVVQPLSHRLLWEDGVGVYITLQCMLGIVVQGIVKQANINSKLK